MTSRLLSRMLRWWTSIHPKAKQAPSPADVLAREIPKYREAAEREAKARRKRYTQAVNKAKKDKQRSLHGALAGRSASLRAYVEGR